MNLNLSLYDRDMNRISVIGCRFESCMWSEGYNTTQPFTLELQANEEYKKKVKEDCYVGRDDRKTLMVIKTVRVKDGHIIATGKEAKRCLDDVACEKVIPAGSNLADAVRGAYAASSKFHSAYEGGLCDHSLNVYNAMIDRYNDGKPDESFAIVALLHDLCKVNFYVESTRNVKENGAWVQKPYYTIDDKLPYGHGEKSVYILNGFIRLSREEAISKMKRALYEFIISGIDTNIEFQNRILNNENYLKDQFDTSFLSEML